MINKECKESSTQTSIDLHSGFAHQHGFPIDCWMANMTWKETCLQEPFKDDAVLTVTSQ